MPYFIGYDIGGTKCAVILGNEKAQVLERIAFDTRPERSWRAVVDELFSVTDALLARNEDIEAFGISCGGPLDSRRGIIYSPPNLPGWDAVPICDVVTERYHKPCRLQNDANACALAEWKHGAGKGAQNMIFLTFGTGMGAGLILNGSLYVGTNDLAGEVGHIRLEKDGPLGYGKHGSFEGFCSGGGIADMAATRARELSACGIRPAFIKDNGSITTKDVALAAAAGDKEALKILEKSGKMLGQGLAILIDILNPELIVIGSVYARAREFLHPFAEEIIKREALPLAASVCKIVPAALGEAIGDIAALTVAADRY